MSHSVQKQVSKYLSIVLVIIILASSIPIEVFAMQIIPSSSSTGKIPTAAEKAPKLDNILPKSGEAPVELKSRRTTHSKEYINPDGSFTTEITPRAMFYKNDKGLMEEIDNNIIPVKATEYNYVKRMPLKCYLQTTTKTVT